MPHQFWYRQSGMRTCKLHFHRSTRTPTHTHTHIKTINPFLDTNNKKMLKANFNKSLDRNFHGLEANDLWTGSIFIDHCEGISSSEDDRKLLWKNKRINTCPNYHLFVDVFLRAVLIWLIYQLLR